MSTTMIDEARDPNTPPERLRELAKSWQWQVANAASANPSLPGDAHVELLLRGNAAAWSNPQTPFTILIYGSDAPMLQGARLAAYAYWSPSRGFDLEALQQNLASILDPWWETTGEGTGLWAVWFVVRRILGGEEAKEALEEVYRAFQAQTFHSDQAGVAMRQGREQFGRWLSTGDRRALDQAMRLARMVSEFLTGWEDHDGSPSAILHIDTVQARAASTALLTLTQMLLAADDSSIETALVLSEHLLVMEVAGKAKDDSEALTEDALQARLRQKQGVVADAVRRQQPQFPWVQQQAPKGVDEDEDEELLL